MKLKKLSSIFLAKFISGSTCVLYLIGCNAAHKDPRQIFRYNEQEGIATLDPAFAKNQSIIWAVHQIYNTLVQTDDSLHLVPSLAQSWNISADNLVFTFHLRNDVFFQDKNA